jgi:prepilin-type N-terminal cleavage/methylation domain-containing protein
MSGSTRYRGDQKPVYHHAGLPSRGWNMGGRAVRKRQDVDERGFTLVEMLLSVVILSIIIGLSTTTVRMFYTQSADVQNTFAVTNQVLLASEILTEYTHDGVASCPAPFVDTNDTGTTTGPAKLSVSVTGTTLTATLAQPTGGCPLTSTPSTVCTYGTGRTIATVLNETNPTPFSYLIAVGGSCSSASIPNPTTTGTPTQISEIVAMCINLDAQMKGGQQAGYQSLAYLLSPSYTMNAG